MTHPLPSQIRLSPQALFQPMGDEGVVLSLATEHYYGLNAVGARLWRLLAEHGSAEAAVPTLLAEFEVDEATLRADVAEWLERLRAAQLLDLVA